MDMANRGTGVVLEHHMDVLGEGLVDATVLDYAPDAVIVTSDGVVKGHEEIRNFFINLARNVLPPGSSFELIAKFVEGEIA